MAGETFQLRFRNNEDVTVSIDEPINFATVDFQLSQKDKGYGRDVSFNGGETQFEFVKYRNHYLDKLLDYNKTYGFESIVELVITTVVSPPTIIGELDFATAVTDDLEYFKCKVIQQSSKQIVKRRKAVKVDLLSDKDIDGNYITPLVPQNILLLSKPIYQNSKWDATKSYGGSNDYIQSFWSLSDTSAFHDIVYVTFANKLVLSGLQNATGPLNYLFTRDASNVTYITAAIDLKNVVIKIPASSFNFRFNRQYPTANTVTCEYKFIVQYNSTTQVLKTNVFNTQDEQYSFNDEFTINIPSITSGGTIKIYHSFDFDMQNIGTPYYVRMYLTTGLQSIKIEAETSTFNSIAPSFRLVDVMRQVVRSISGLDISAPRFEFGQDFYDNRLLNGNSLRAISTKPFLLLSDESKE